MTGRRMAAVKRLRGARLSMRNAAGGRLAEAEAIVLAAMAKRNGIRELIEQLNGQAVIRLVGPIRVNDLLRYADDRECARAALEEASARVARTQESAADARAQLASAERELRRVERVLARLVYERQRAENKAEQAVHDDVVNYKHYLGGGVEE
ncbi:MAG: hypothetical protein V2A73_01760 [Pseudomonadota bacterium]